MRNIATHISGSRPDSGAPAPRRTRRRSRIVLVAATAVAAIALAACGGSSGGGSDDAAAASGPAKVGIQFVFIKNVQFAGSMFADANGYWKDAGLDVEMLAGGANVTVEPVVTSGKALVGITHTAQAAEAINNGADLQIIGAGFQQNPFVLISQAAKPIKTPAEMAGKKIGVQAHDLPLFDAFVTANKIDPKSFTVVPLQDDPTPLVNGELDGIMGFYTNEPNFLRTHDVEPYNLLLGDFNYPLLEEAYIVKKSNLADPEKRKQIVALMAGESKGWADAVADIPKAVDLAVNTYGKDLKLDPEQQTLAMTSEVDLVKTPDTDKNGLFWMTPEAVAGTVNSLKLGGVEANADMFTNDVLKEVYAGKAAS